MADEGNKTTASVSKTSPVESVVNEVFKDAHTSVQKAIVEGLIELGVQDVADIPILNASEGQAVVRSAFLERANELYGNLAKYNNSSEVKSAIEVGDVLGMPRIDRCSRQQLATLLQEGSGNHDIFSLMSVASQK